MFAAAEEQQAPVARAKRTPKREVTVDLAAVKPEDEFEGVVVSSIRLMMNYKLSIRA